MALPKRGFRVGMILAVLSAMLVFRAAPALAAVPPANDDFDQATVITATPFTDTVDTSAATMAADDPITCGPPSNTMWYAFTPSANETVLADTGGSGFFSVISA